MTLMAHLHLYCSIDELSRRGASCILDLLNLVRVFSTRPAAGKKKRVDIFLKNRGWHITTVTLIFVLLGFQGFLQLLQYPALQKY